MWVYQATLDRMMCVVRKQHKLVPSLDQCSKQELQELWDKKLWDLDMLISLLENDDISAEDESSILVKICEAENELERIDYEWSRFPY
jgi:hypothetical protein